MKYGTVEEDVAVVSTQKDVESLQRRRDDDVGEKSSKHHRDGTTTMMRNGVKTIALACGACAVTFAVSKAASVKGGGSFLSSSGGGGSPSSDFGASLGGLRSAPKRGFSRGASAAKSSPKSSREDDDDDAMLPPINAGFAKVKERVAMERRRAEEMENGRGYATEDNGISSSSFTSSFAEEEPLTKREPKTADLGVPMECKSCALVLPTPEMSGQSLGKEIDSHECVARINTHYLDAADEKNAKFREDFGTKTDFVFANVVPHTLDELNRGDHSKIDEKVKHKILVLRTLEEEDNSDSSSSTKIPYQDPGSAKPEDVYRFLDANEGWVVTPDVISKEASELFSSLSGTEKKLWSSGFLAYTTLTRHFCASTTVYALPEDEGIDNASKTDYFSTSLSSQRQMWEGHSFGAEHTFIREEAEKGDYGVAVKTVVDQEKLAREEALRKEQEAAQKEQDEAQAAIAKKEAENVAMISAQHLAAKSAIDAAQEAAAKVSLLQQQQAEEIVEDSVPQPEVIAAGKESASTGSEEVVGAATVVDPNADLVGDQSTCTESFKDLFCNPALQCIGGIPCPGQGCCDRTSCNPADSCMPGIPIPGIGCCRDAEDWRPEWGPSRIDKSNPSALVNVVLEDGTPKSIMVSELDDYINARVLQMTNPPPKDGVEGDIGNGGNEGDDDDTIIPASEKKKIVVKKLKNPKEQKMLFELHGHKHKTKENARLGMAAPTEEELIAALGKHHHHAEQTDNEKPATKTKSADMFDMSKVETAKETTWRSGAAGGVTNNQAIKGNNFMKDGKYDPPMFCDDSEHCSPGQRWPGVGCCTPDSCNPDPSPNCQAGIPMPGYGCCSDKNTYRWDDKENRYKKIEYKEVTKEDLQVMMATKSLDVPGIEKPKISYESIIGKDDVDLSSANVEAPDDNVIADFIQGKTPEKETASDESSEEGEAEAKAEVTKEFQELVGDEDTVAVEEKEDAPEAESKPLFCNQQTEGCVAGVPIPGIPCCNAPDICNPEPKETCVAGVPLPGIPCCFQRQPHAQNPDAQKDSALAKSLESSSKKTCNPDPKCTPGVPIPGVGCCKNGWGKVDGNAVEQLDTSTTEKKEILKDSVEALVLKKRIREELQRKDQLVSHNAKEKKVTTDADTGGSEKQQKKIDARANTLANEDDKPIEDEPVEGGVPAQEEKSAEHQRQHHERHKSVSEERRAEDDVNDVNDVNDDDKKSSSSKKHKNKASGKPEVWDSDY